MVINGTNDGTLVDIGTESTTLLLAQCSNKTGDWIFVQFFNLAAADVTLGTTPAYMTMELPPNGGNTWADLDGQRLFHFPTACSFAVTTTRTGATGPAIAAGVLVVAK